MHRAHPRSRGENKSRRSCRIRLVGSSPLTRGKPGPGARERSPPRLIPAHAGKTVVSRVAAIAMYGSSPLTRGKLRNVWRAVLRNGLIPAHAGKTRRRGPRRNDGRAHPRSRGENAPIATTIRPIGGSSPLTRGKLRSRSATPWGWPAHPRSRGENNAKVAHIAVLAGSSPLTRGKRDARAEFLVGSGLIPAHAGKTMRPSRPTDPRGAHPRSRGENEVERMTGEKPAGSSPLTRGKHGRPGVGVLRPGLIPAHAGKT